MLLLFETAAGFALFKVNKEDKLEQTNVSAHSRRPAVAHCCCPADLPTPLPAAGLCQGLRERGWRQEGAPVCRHTPMCQLHAKGMGASHHGGGSSSSTAADGLLLSATSAACPQVVKLKAFSKFENTTEALAAATALVESKLSKGAVAAFAHRSSMQQPLLSRGL